MTISDPAPPPATLATFIPPYLLTHLAESGPPETAERCRRTLSVDQALRERRTTPREPGTPTATTAGPDWIVHDAQNGSDLPGTPVRTAGPDDAESGDPAVDEAASGTAAALDLFSTAFGRDSYDGAGATALVTVHYERDYANAFWDGTHLVFGDGDGQVLDRFTKAVDVVGHELSHGIVEHTAGLVYQGQPGALNESVCDAFAACLKQRVLDQGVEQADWLIGQGLFLPDVQARALRDMAAPGTAYDDPRLGQDPQPAHMDDYVETTDDNGGVHINSGIPNRAFTLAATAIGGRSWEGAGPIWYAALTGGQVGPQTDFAGFAAATVAAAGEHAEAVAGAWREVGVVPAGQPTAPRAVRVTRSGGFAGLTTTSTLDLDADDEAATRARGLLGRIDLAQVGVMHESGAGGSGAAAPRPDAFVYGVEVDGTRVDVGEAQLSGDLATLVRLVLEGPTDPPDRG